MGRVKRGTWQIWDNVEKKIKTLWGELGYFPATSDLKENGLGGVLAAINNYFGGIKKVRNKMGGEVYLAKKRSKWSDLNLVLQKVREVEIQIGHFPTVKEMRELGYKDLIGAVYNYHNNWENIRLQLGQEKKFNRWDSLNTILVYLRGLIKELGHFPSKEELIDRGSSSILIEIQEKYGGIYYIYNLLDIDPPKKPDGYWKDRDNVIKHLEEVEAELGHFPSLDELRNNGYSGMASGIYRHHEGYKEIKKILNVEQHQVPDGYFEDFNKIKPIILELKEKIGRFPTIIELENYRPGIKYAIRTYHEGYIEVRKKMGAEIIQKPDGYWKDFKNVKRELLKLENKLGIFPTFEMIQEKGPKGLNAGIYLYHGSLNNVREKLGKEIIYPSVLEAYVKSILDRWVKDDKYLDNKRHELKYYGVELVNAETNQPLEIDRYYYEAKVAIEIQGHQHKYPASLFTKIDSDSIKTFKHQKKIDNYKRKQLEEQGIDLIEIDFNDYEKEILEKISEKLMLREKPLSLKEINYNYSNTETYHQYKNKDKAREALLKIQEKANEKFITSDDVRENNASLYTALKKFYGGIHGGRNLIKLNHPRKPRNSWTREKVKKKINELIELNKRFPNKKELQNYEKGLYYAVTKFGGIRNFKKEINN